MEQLQMVVLLKTEAMVKQSQVLRHASYSRFCLSFSVLLKFMLVNNRQNLNLKNSCHNTSMEM